MKTKKDLKKAVKKTSAQKVKKEVKKTAKKVAAVKVKKAVNTVKPAVKKASAVKKKEVKQTAKKIAKKAVKQVKNIKKTVKKVAPKVSNTLKTKKKTETKKNLKQEDKASTAKQKEIKKTVKQSVKKERTNKNQPQAVTTSAPSKIVKTETDILTQAEIKEIEIHLLEMKKEVQERIKSKKEAEMPDTEVGDEADVASQNLDKEVLFELNGNAQVLLDQIESALRRISKGIYGTCEYCRCQIPKQRILAVPFARYCIKCQSSNEKRR